MVQEEAVNLLNDLIRQTGCRVFVAAGTADVYQQREHVCADDLLVNAKFEIGDPQNFSKIAGRPISKIYREQRVDFVSAYIPRLPATSAVLLETNFHADSSPTALVIGKGIRKWLKKNAHQGVLVRALGTTGERVEKGVWWTDKAHESNKTWKQAENSLVYFVPA